MKLPVLVASSLLLVVGFAHPSRGGETSQAATAPAYTVGCRLIDRTDGTGKARIVTPPKFSVFAGKPAQILDQTQRPFVVATAPVPGDESAHQPVIAVLSEGFALEFCINDNGSGLVTVDVTFEEQTIERVDIKDVVPGKVSVQSPRQCSTKQRVFELAKLGQSTSVALDGKSLKESKHSLEFVVTQDKP